MNVSLCYLLTVLNYLSIYYTYYLELGRDRD